MARRTGPHTKTAVTRKRSDQIGRAQCLNGANAEAHKRLLDKNRGPISKNGFSGQNPDFWAKKKHTLFNSNHVPATTGQSCQKEKVPFFQSLSKFWVVVITKNGFSARFSLFGQTQKRPFLRNSGRDRLRWLPISFFWCPGYSSQFSSTSDQN